MIISEIEFILKDGRKALIRSPQDEDIPGMLSYLYQFIDVLAYLIIVHSPVSGGMRQVYS